MALLGQAIMPMSRLSPSSHDLITPRLCSFCSPKPSSVLKAHHHTARSSRANQAQLVTEQRTDNSPTSWDYNYVQSLTRGFNDKEYMEELGKMKEEVKGLLKANRGDPLAELELIDVIQQLGLHYHFEAEIQNALDIIQRKTEDSGVSGDLHATALRFRLLRQHGYNVPQDVFKSFLNEAGNFRDSLKEDLKGLLSLYEASFHGLKGETMIDKAIEFSRVCLKDMDKNRITKRLAMKVDRALDIPMHWMPSRLVATWFMGAYEEEPDMNHTLLKLATLDFNVVRSIHMNEFAQLERWWLELGLGAMTFARDNLMEQYLWSVTILFEPRYRAIREMITKITCMITLIDDVYDKLGSLVEELELMTHVVDRWDNTRAGELPPVMRTCFQALYTITNQIGYWILIERGIDVNQYLQKAWADQCKAYLVEAKWCHEGTKPTLKDYLSNAVRSVGGIIVLLCCFFVTTDSLTEEEVDYISRIPSIMESSTLVVRLNNDLVPSSSKLAEGDQLNSVQCLMNETGASEVEARVHIESLVHEAWKTMNGDMLDDGKNRLAGRTFMAACWNLARASHWIYRHGDGHEVRSREAKRHLMSILVDPIHIY